VVIVDIDDTLWRGVAADDSVSAVERIEGWPMGMIEALGFLKRRGVLLALVSKNEEPTIERIWPSIIPNERLALADFAVRRINWRPKADNIAEILELLNLLPRSALFVDDNPVERAAVQSAFPDIRVIGPNPYVWRRLLLWAPETQVATITAESAKRTEMVQGQVERETKRKVLPRAEFLMSLKLAVAVRRIARADDPGFKRALELINKTNQFNTTGKRWTEQEFAALFGAGGYLIATRAKDKFSDYGIIGVMIVAQARVVQFVMSCRVVGLDVEIATIGHALRLMADAGEVQARADLVETDANLLSRDLWPRSGFAPDGAGWTRPLHEALPLPAHVTLVIEDVPAVAVA
jgi:FkbH-like protein